MAKSFNFLAFPKLKRLRQETDFYCGPAVVQMLLSFLDIEVKQLDIVMAADVNYKIKEHGMTLEELALAAKRLVPMLQFWYKRYGTISELSQIINEWHFPAGVEWQGVFEGEDEEESGDDDPGHYSVVTQLNTFENLVMIADPYKQYVGKDRRFTVLEFERRWWDINEVINPFTRKVEQVDDYHAMFIVTPKTEIFPEKLNMNRG